MIVKYKRNGVVTYSCTGQSTPSSRQPQPQTLTGPFAHCNSCPYARHGFICWSKDGSCLKTDMDRIYHK